MRYHRPTRAARPPGCYVFVFDGDCGFCTRTARALARREIRLIPFAEVPAGEILGALTPEQIRASSHCITPDGREYHGGESVTRLLRLLPGGRLLVPFDLPGLSLLRELAYAVVARNRSLVGKIYR